ncbi:MAG: PASTA domain-containing protein [Acidobacteria bacterium]|nr:MAG: PASTA domain-containing protein [Acidobacteriota bacterium]
MPDSDSPTEAQGPSRYLTVGKTFLLIAILITVGIISAVVGIRVAVRGDEVQVPQLVGQSVEDAKKSLAKLDLLLEVHGERYDPRVGVGKIVSQLPPTGGRTKANRPVQVIVSLGARRNPIPELLGSSMRSAQLMVLQSGYELGNVSTITLDNVGQEGVIQQYPTPQSREVLSQKIDVLVNTRHLSRFVMPDIMGQNIAVVTAFLESNNMRVSPPVYREYQNADKGVVVKQYPEPGYMVTREDPISLEVAR